MPDMRTDATRDDLLDLFRHAGDELATVYLPTVSAVEDARDRLDIRVGNVLSELAERGASPAVVDGVTRALEGHDHAAGAGLVLVASPAGVLLHHPTIRPVARTVVHVGPTPQLLPILRATQADIDHLAILLDRSGADAWTRHDLGEPVAADSVDGDDEHIHRGHPGGWSQRRFQQRAENTWEANAKLVVEEIVADDDRPEVLVIGGDVRAVGFFRQHLPADVEVIEVEGSRAADHDAFLDRVDTAIRSLAAARLVDEIGELRDAVAEGRGAAGREVLMLATQGRIDRLYVVDDTFADDRPTSRFDFTVPMVVDDDTPSGEGGITMAPSTEGAVTLAVATGAEVIVLPTEVAGLGAGVAGLLRG